MTTISVLEIGVSTVYFAHKVFVLAGQKTGWLVGAFASLFAFVYFSLIGLYFLTILQVGLLILMIYGFYKKEKKSPKVEMAIRTSTIIVMFTLALFAWKGVMTAAELFDALGLLWGTYLLTHGKSRGGWFLYLLAQIPLIWIGYEKHQVYFADMQIASAVVSVVGLVKKEKK